MKIMTIVILILLGLQSNAQLDTTEAPCHRIFSMCEEPPSIIQGAKVYEKILSTYLQDRSELPVPGKALLNLVISNTGEVFDIIVKYNSSGNIDLLLSAIKKYANQWKVGKQNGYNVCAYCKILVEISDKAIIVQDMTTKGNNRL